MAASLLGLALSLAGGQVFAEPGLSPEAVQVASAQPFAADDNSLHFSKEPSTSFGSDKAAKEANTPANPFSNVIRLFKDPAPTSSAPASSFSSGPLLMSKDADRPSSFGTDTIRLTKEPLQLTPPTPARITVAPAGKTPYNAPIMNSSDIQRVALQADKMAGQPGGTEEQEYFIQLEPPSPQRLFRLDGEPSLQERMRQEALQRPSPDRIEFPTYKPLTTDKFAGRQWPGQTMTIEPAYVCYGKLLFENINVDRYGWDLGIVGPFESALHFYKDVVLLPYHCGMDCFRKYECDAGYCLPGDPVPYMCYPPHYSLTGAACEIAAGVAIAFIFP
jgi:hypothetical protein